MRVGVFGAGGFLGSELLGAFRERGHDVTAIGRSGLGVVHADLIDAASLEKLPALDVLFVAAARVPKPADDESAVRAMFEANALGAANVAAFATKREIASLVYCSTLAVVARPWPAPLTEEAATYPLGAVAPYAASKLAGELLVRSLAKASRVLVPRLSALYGPRMEWHGVLPNFVDRALRGEPLDVVRGASADFLHVEDAARILVELVESEGEGVINVASGAETSLEVLANEVVRAEGTARSTVSIRDGASSRAEVSVTRLRNAVPGFAVRTVREGVAELVAHRRTEQRGDA